MIIKTSAPGTRYYCSLVQSYPKHLNVCKKTEFALDEKNTSVFQSSEESPYLKWIIYSPIRHETVELGYAVYVGNMYEYSS